MYVAFAIRHVTLLGSIPQNGQTLKELFQTNCLSVFDHFVGLAFEGLIVQHIDNILQIYSIPIHISYH